jgi:hypothetical protein
LAVAAVVAALVGAYLISPWSDGSEPREGRSNAAPVDAPVPSGTSDVGPTSTHVHDHRCPDAGQRVGTRWRCVTQDAILLSAWAFTTKPDAAQEQRAAEFVDRVTSSIERYADVEAARRDGYLFNDRLSWVETTKGTQFGSAARSELAAGTVAHLVNERLANDGTTADPEHPEALMYATDGSKYVLVGAMFLAPIGVDGPQVGGPLTTWHVHDKGDVVCWDGAASVGFAKLVPGDPRYEPSGGCARGAARKESPQMLHVWLDRPTLSATFDSEMSDSEAAALLR